MNLNNENDESNISNEITNHVRQSNKQDRLRKSVNSFAIINARSLPPKIDSLAEFFEEEDWSFAMLTETWLIDGPVCEGTKEELGNQHGIELITLNRREKAGRNTGGGVALAYKKSKITLTNYPARKNGCEFLIAKGRFGGLSLIHI